jgi:CheY-like chemotaxis protein
MFEDRDHVDSQVQRSGWGGRDADDDAEPLRGVTVLIAEDRPELLAAMRRIFLAAGAVVRACDHPADAAEALTAAPEGWDLLVTDFEMPHMTGADLAALARIYAPKLPTILCTGLNEDAPEVARAAGLFTRVVRKPATDAALVLAAVEALRAGGPQ